jgi:hypothetical protein
MIYLHLNSKWIGHATASSTLSPAVFAGADPVVAWDNAERQVEEMEEYGEDETDVLGTPRQDSPIPHLSPSSSSSSSFFSSFLFSPHEGLQMAVAVGGITTKECRRPAEAAGTFLVSQATPVACAPSVWNKGLQLKGIGENRSRNVWGGNFPSNLKKNSHPTIRMGSLLMPNSATTTAVGSFAHPCLARCLAHYADRGRELKRGSSERADRRCRRKLFVV